MLLFLSVIKEEVIRNELEQLYMKHRKEMYKVSFGILRDHYEAQDVVQSTIIKLADNLDKLHENDDRRTRAFIFMIVRNLSINIYNKRKTTNVTNIMDSKSTMDDSESPENIVIRLEQASWVADQLNVIKPEYADILTFKYTYELSTVEISKLINISESGVRVKLMRAKKALYNIMEEAEHERTS